MKTEEYIASGILEAYLFGEVTEDERADVEEKMRLHPAVLAEFRRLEEVQERLLMSTGVVPPPHLQSRIMSRIPDPRAGVGIRRNAIPWMLATAASVTIALISVYFAISYKQQLENTTKDLDNLMARNRQMAEQYNQVNQQVDLLENTLEVIDNPAYKKVVLRGTESFPQSMASVYWNEGTSEVFLTVQNLDKLSREQQFQLWAIVDGSPVDAGVFDASEVMLKMKSMKRASAFAVTVEPAGGSAAPTLSSMVLIGTV